MELTSIKHSIQIKIMIYTFLLYGTIAPTVNYSQGYCEIPMFISCHSAVQKIVTLISVTHKNSYVAATWFFLWLSVSILDMQVLTNSVLLCVSQRSISFIVFRYIVHFSQHIFNYDVYNFNMDMSVCKQLISKLSATRICVHVKNNVRKH